MINPHRFEEIKPEVPPKEKIPKVYKYKEKPKKTDEDGEPVADEDESDEDPPQEEFFNDPDEFSEEFQQLTEEEKRLFRERRDRIRQER